MKIAIVGTSSTGKTTLITKLTDRLRELRHSVEVVPEVARECPYPLNEGSTLEAQQWILAKQLEHEHRIDHRGKIVLCDRASIDNWAYFFRAFHHAPRTRCDVHIWEALAVDHAASYDFIFKTQKLPLGAVADGVRSGNELFREEIDHLISLVLRQHAITHVVLPRTIDYNVHVNFIVDHLERSAVYQRS